MEAQKCFSLFLRPQTFPAHVNLNVNIETHKKAASRVAEGVMSFFAFFSRTLLTKNPQRKVESHHNDLA
jgi:hypothetical protein